ncbi:hypothetical protein K501DRAFT_297464 [Backusella circina FSU 941]|nr:hypothetical protein K501DRAFT_297464 [Backusella circina FSU 941]
MQAQGAINPQNIAMAEQELEMTTDLFNRITESCHKKCISTKYKDSELASGETSCIDLCVAKFIEVNMKIGEKMQTMGGQ